MPQVNIDGLTVDVDDVATAKVINDALKASAARADAAQTQLALFKEDALKEDGKVPPAFLKHMKKKKGEEEDDDDKDDADELTDDDTRSAHDAEMDALRSERDALQGQLDALYADEDEDDDEDDNDDADDELKGKSAKHPKKDPEQGELKGKSKSSSEDEDDKDDSRSDSDRQAWFQERQGLVAVAASLRIDSFEDLKNAELKRAIVAEHTGKDVSGYSADRIDGAMPHIIAKVAARQDSLDRAARALLPKTPEQRTDAQGDYRNRLLTAYKS